MIPKCPGQDDRNIKAQVISCPHCGYDAEIFSDEFKRHCPKCRNTIFKDKLPSCADWCKSARKCIGEDKWRQSKGS